MNIIEKLALKKLPYYYDFGKEEVNNYDIVNAIKSTSVIQEFYNDINYSIKNVDDYVNYLFIEHLNNINGLNVSTFKSEYEHDIEKIKYIITQIRNKYCIKNIIEYVKSNYKEIFEYYSKEDYNLERNSINIHIRLELRDATIRLIPKFFDKEKVDEIIKYLIDYDVILFFDNKDLFKSYKIKFIEKLNNKIIIERLIDYRYIKLLKFLGENKEIFKQSPNYNMVIENFIRNVKDEKKHIYQREKQCANLIHFLKHIKETKVRNVEKVHNKLIKEADEEIKRNGHIISRSVNLKDDVKAYKKLLREPNVNDFTKLIYPNTIIENGRKYVLIENIDKIDIGLTSEIFGQDPYYCSIRTMQVEQFIIPIFNMFLFKHTIKNIGYRRLESLIVRLINRIFSTLFIEYSEDEIKKDIKGIMYSIKNCYKEYKMKSERNYMYYINSMYVISYIEKLLRKIYVAVYEKDVYIDDNKITLGNILNEKDKTKLELIIGKNLFKWIKYFLFNIESSMFEDKIGYSYRNKMCHYRDIIAIEDLSNKIYYDAIYLFFNLIIAVHLNVLNYPNEETEKIIIEQFEKLI